MSKRRLSAEELARQDERQAALGRIQGRWVENANSHGHHYEHDAPPTLEEMLARAMTRIVELETELDARINWAAAHESQKVESEVMTEDRDEYADALYRYKRMTREQRDAVNLFADHITMRGRP